MGARFVQTIWRVTVTWSCFGMGLPDLLIHRWVNSPFHSHMESKRQSLERGDGAYRTSDHSMLLPREGHNQHASMGKSEPETDISRKQANGRSTLPSLFQSLRQRPTSFPLLWGLQTS